MTTLDRIFNDNEKNELARFVDNRVMFEAVKKVVLSSIYFDGTIQKDGIPDPMTNFMLALVATNLGNHEELGKKVEASLAGVQLLEQGFRKLGQFSKRKEPKQEKPNPAR